MVEPVQGESKHVSATSWKKTPEQIRKIEAVMAKPAFLNGRSLTVRYLTRPEIVKAVLPPPLEPAAEPMIAVGIGVYRGGSLGPFAGGSLTIRARYRELEGNFVLAMYVDTDVSMTFGRELFGEPKKLAKASLTLDPASARGALERY
jgi:acetoacetate decarboxylase